MHSQQVWIRGITVLYISIYKVGCNIIKVVEERFQNVVESSIGTSTPVRLIKLFMIGRSLYNLRTLLFVYLILGLIARSID